MTKYLLRGVTCPIEFSVPGGVVTLGRNPTNRLVLPDPSVSGFHAEVKVLEGGAGLWIRDLGSTNGTFLDGALVAEAVAQPGQRVNFGTVETVLNAETVEIRIPNLAAPPVAQAAGTLNTLPDGALACSRNPQLPATHQAQGGCTAVVRCPGVFNVNSLRTMALSGNQQALFFCPDCNTRCEPISGGEAVDARARGKGRGGLLRRLTQTVPLGWLKSR